MRRFQVTTDQAQVHIACKKGVFVFYENEIITDEEIARSFPNLFREIDSVYIETAITSIPAPVFEAVAEAVEEFVAAPVEEEAIEEAEEMTEPGEEADEVVEDAATQAPIKEKSKPGRKGKK